MFLVFVTTAAAQQPQLAPTIEIATNVFMPLINDGYSNRSLWINHNGRGLDTALSYGDADQRNVGEAIRASGLPRSAFFVTSKIPCCPAKNFPFPYAQSCNARNTTADVEETLRVLGLDSVDLMLMHWPCDDFANTVATWKSMEPLVARGSARSIGVSNFNTSALSALIKQTNVKPAVNQCGYSIGGHFESLWGRDDGTIAACSDLGVSYSAYSPLGNWAKSGVDIFTDPTVLSVAATHHVTAAEVALRWVVQQNISAVTAATKAEFAGEDLSIFSFELSAVEMARLSAVRKENGTATETV